MMRTEIISRFKAEERSVSLKSKLRVFELGSIFFLPVGYFDFGCTGVAFRKPRATNSQFVERTGETIEVMKTSSRLRY